MISPLVLKHRINRGQPPASISSWCARTGSANLGTVSPHSARRNPNAEKT